MRSQRVSENGWLEKGFSHHHDKLEENDGKEGDLSASGEEEEMVSAVRWVRKDRTVKFESACQLPGGR